MGQGAWNGAGSVEIGLRGVQERTLKRVGGGAKMDAKAVVLQELKSGRNSDKLASALSLLTSLG